MSRPKKKKQIVMSKTALRKMEDEVTRKVLILSAAYLMDDWEYSEDALIEYWDGLTRYVEAIDQKLITIHKVCEIIEEHTGLKIL